MRGGRDGGKNEGGRQKKEGRRDADMRGVNSKKNEGKRRGDGWREERREETDG